MGLATSHAFRAVGSLPAVAAEPPHPKGIGRLLCPISIPVPNAGLPHAFTVSISKALSQREHESTPPPTVNKSVLMHPLFSVPLLTVF